MDEGDAWSYGGSRVVASQGLFDCLVRRKSFSWPQKPLPLSSGFHAVSFHDPYIKTLHIPI